MAIYNINYINEMHCIEANNKYIEESDVYESGINIIQYIYESIYEYDNIFSLNESSIKEKVGSIVSELVRRLKEFWTTLKKIVKEKILKFKFSQIKKKIRDSKNKSKKINESSLEEFDVNHKLVIRESDNDIFEYYDFSDGALLNFISRFSSFEELEKLKQNSDNYIKQLKNELEPFKDGSLYFFEKQLKHPSIDDLDKFISDMEKRSNDFLKLLDQCEKRTISNVNHMFKLDPRAMQKRDMEDAEEVQYYKEDLRDANDLIKAITVLAQKMSSSFTNIISANIGSAQAFIDKINRYNDTHINQY